MKKFSILLILIVTSLFSFTVEANAEEGLNIYGIKDQQSVRSQLTAKEWTDFAENNNVPLKKAWTVTFNQEVTFDKLDGAVIEQNQQFIPVDISIVNKNKLTIKPVTRYDANGSYTLKLFLKNGKRYRMNFKTTMDLNTLLDPIKVATKPYHYEEQIIKVPAMPEKGFNFPYYLRVPSAQYKYHDGNNSSKRYIVLDTANSGPSNAGGTEYWVESTLRNQSQLSVRTAEQLWTPMIMPAIPRSHVCYKDEYSELNCIDEHSFDRDTARLKQLLKFDFAHTIRAEYLKRGLQVEDYVDWDQQVLAMFAHASSYLNSYGQQVETDKMFLSGYSSGGTFTDRLSMLHPDKVKAVASGATLDDMVMPTAQHNGEQLIFPIGVADYEMISGKRFNLSETNEMAKLVYMGKDDANVTLPYYDAFGDRERNIIIRAFSKETLPRAKMMMNLYHQSGGNAMFILDKDIAHGYSDEMVEYQINFFKVNRNSDKAVYPIPKNPNQLEYQLQQDK